MNETRIKKIRKFVYHPTKDGLNAYVFTVERVFRPAKTKDRRQEVLEHGN